jgi:hypothetical protein
MIIIIIILSVIKSYCVGTPKYTGVMASAGSGGESDGL